MSAFEACRDLMTNGMVAGGMPADKVAEQMAFWECMAEQGWIWFQPAAYDVATTCGPRSTGG